MRALLTALLLTMSLSGAGRGQTATLPADLELTLLLKVMSFDRTLEHAGDVVVVLLYQGEVPALAAKRDAWLKAARSTPRPQFGDATVEIIAIRYTGTTDLLAQLRSYGALVVMIPSLRAVDTRRLADDIRAAGIRTVSDDADFARRATSIGLVLRDSRPHIIINLSHARKEGSDYSAQLLRLAEVLR